MFNFKKVAFALLLTLGILFSVCVPAFAGTTVTGGDVSFDKYLIMDENANVPTTEFTYTIAKVADTLAPTTDGVLISETWTDTTETVLKSSRVYATDGNDAMVTGTPTVKTTPKFKPTDASYTTKQGDDTVVLAAGQKYATHNIVIDFSTVTFKRPGIFRYKLSENNLTLDGITNDSLLDRYVDIYVEQDTGSTVNNNLKVAGAAVHRSPDTIPLKDLNWSTVLKDNGFQNVYTTYDLDITKEIRGNQGYRDEVFDFTLKIEGNPCTRYYIAYSTTDTDTSVAASLGTLYASNIDGLSKDGSRYYLTDTNEDGKITYNFKLSQHDTLTVYGLTATTKYSVSEDNQDYDPAYSVNGAAETAGDTVALRAMGARDNSVLFANTKEWTVPTGISIQIVAPIVVGAVAVAYIVFTVISKKKKSGKDSDEE